LADVQVFRVVSVGVLREALAAQIVMPFVQQIATTSSETNNSGK
jgi:hypothetical protein